MIDAMNFVNNECPYIADIITSVTKCKSENDAKSIRGLMTFLALMRIGNQKFKGLSEAIGLSLVLKGTKDAFFDFAVKMGISCSKRQCLNILDKKTSTALQVYINITDST